MDRLIRLPAGTNWGSPNGVTRQDHWATLLWGISGWFALPIGVIVIGLIAWALVRYRYRPDRPRIPAQFQYHIPIEAAYTIIPLAIVAVLFGFMFNAENKQGVVAAHPAVAIEVQGFQWGWRFVYPNGHVQVGTADYNDINDNNGLPVLVLPSDETVQLHVVSLDVVHTFYVKDFLFNRDLIPGIDNKFDINVKQPGLYPGQCNNICGQYHAYMRFYVQVLSPTDYASWYANQPACSVTTAGGPNDAPAVCDSTIQGLNPQT
ncbi:MAG TPA: cytochrome c oxidase subunit II [Acidimicrobiales bacterium]|nr:cytochrome c oxidase subunit II [Acidimicrobiales bacterium]